MEKDESLANELLNNQIENAKKRYEYYKKLDSSLKDQNFFCKKVVKLSKKANKKYKNML